MRTINLIQNVAFYFFMPAALAVAPCEPFHIIVEKPAIRAAIDIGSGATKLRIAQVNVKDQKIEKILVDQAFTVPYQEHLEKSPNNSFDEAVMQTGIDSLKKSAEIAKQYNVDKVIAVATAAFRKATNAEMYIQRIEKETGIKIYIIDQELEGKLAFEAALNQSDVDSTDLVVWDIGGGSFQLTTQNADGSYDIYRGHLASVPFKNLIIKTIQHKNPEQVKSPNPLTTDDIDNALDYAHRIADKVDRIFKERMQHPKVRVVGVGSVFAYGIAPMMKGQMPFKAVQLNQTVKGLAGKTDQDMGGGDFANVSISNAILVLGFMESLKIPELDIIDVNNADGAFLYDPFWE